MIDWVYLAPTDRGEIYTDVHQRLVYVSLFVSSLDSAHLIQLNLAEVVCKPLHDE